MGGGLLLLCLQNDFMEWGSVGVAGADAKVAKANALMETYDVVIAVMDWHPASHVSFAANRPWHKPNQIIEVDEKPMKLWTTHAVQDTFGAELAMELNTQRIDKIIKKGGDEQVECFSPFFDELGEKASDLEAFLRSKGITQLSILGEPEDHDVKITAEHAISLGFEVTML